MSSSPIPALVWDTAIGQSTLVTRRVIAACSTAGWRSIGCPRSATPCNSQQVLARDAVCLLAVLVHTTGTAFTKPVDPVLGQALDTWQAVRPAQPKFTDRRTDELVDLLFALRARRVFASYINNTVIPALRRGRWFH